MQCPANYGLLRGPWNCPIQTFQEVLSRAPGVISLAASEHLVAAARVLFKDLEQFLDLGNSDMIIWTLFYWQGIEMWVCVRY